MNGQSTNFHGFWFAVFSLSRTRISSKESRQYPAITGGGLGYGGRLDEKR